MPIWRPVGHGDEHDIHHTHAAHEQGYARNGRQEQRHRSRNDAEYIGEFGHVSDLEVGFVMFRDAMAICEQSFDFVPGGLNHQF